jgi:hypothetical protein
MAWVAEINTSPSPDLTFLAVDFKTASGRRHKRGALTFSGADARRKRWRLHMSELPSARPQRKRSYADGTHSPREVTEHALAVIAQIDSVARLSKFGAGPGMRPHRRWGQRTDPLKASPGGDGSLRRAFTPERSTVRRSKR